MKKSFMKKCTLTVSSILLFVGSALALPTAGQYVKFDTSSGLGNANGGGEFYLDVATVANSFDGKTDYISFCLEHNEYINSSSYNNSPVYVIESVGDNVTAGGVGGATNGVDPLGDATQWVYYKYMFTDYFGTHTNVLANQIQEIIWYLEGEITTFTIDGAGDLYSSSVVKQANGSYNAYVTAINLKYSDGRLAQSQLIGEAAPVPEPATMLLFGTGIAGLAGIARRKRD